MRVRGLRLYLALAVGCCVGLPAAQGDLPASEVIKNRISNLREIGTAFKGIGDELQGQTTYRTTVQESARHIESLGAEIPTWFPPGSGPVKVPEKGIVDTILGWFSSEDAAGH